MGTWDYDRLRAELKLRHGQRTDFTSSTDWYGRWINNAYLNLCTRNRFWGLKRNFEFPEMEANSSTTTTAGTAYVSVPTTALVIRDVFHYTDDRMLTHIGWDEYVKRTGRATTASRGSPTEWVRSGSYIYLYPTPDATDTLHVFYRKRPTLLSSGTDVTALGAEWDEIIVRMAACQSFLQLGMGDRLKAEKEELNDAIGGLLGIYNQEFRHSDKHMSIDPSYRGGNEYPS